MISGTMEVKDGRLKLDLDLKKITPCIEPGEVRVIAELGDFAAFPVPGECAAEIRVLIVWPENRVEVE